MNKLKKYIRGFIVFMFLLSLMNNSHAVDCNKLISEIEMKQCVSQEYKLLDKQLNKIYSEYRTRLDNVKKKQLKEAKIAWLTYRDLSCNFEASGVKGGEVYPMVHTQCLSQKTRARIIEMENLITCKEDDLSCPAW